MDHTCPRCGTQVAADARACTSCGLAHNVPVFDADGTFLGSTFPGGGRSPRVPPPPAANPGSSSTPPPARLSRKVIALVAGVIILAVVLGVAVAYGIRAGTGTGPTPPTPATGDPTVTPVAPDPLEPPELPVAGPFADVARVASSGTHRLIASTCSGTGVGTAFEFGTEGLLVTSARVVSAARSITVLSGDRVVPATVAKIDTRSGLALLKPQSPVAGHIFDLGTRQLAVGDQAALLGWTTESQSPARGRARAVIGTITEAGLTLESPDGRHPGIRRMSGEFDAGLAGSPVIGSDGLMLGVVVQATKDQDELLVAGLDTVADPLLGPTGMPPAMEACPGASGPQVVTTVGGSAPTATRTELGQWFGALNAGDWDRARGVLSGDLKEEWTRDRLEAEYRGSYAFTIVAAPADGSGVGSPGLDGSEVDVSWVLLHPEGDRQCSRLLARIVLEPSGIQSITPQGVPTPCS